MSRTFFVNGTDLNTIEHFTVRKILPHTPPERIVASGQAVSGDGGTISSGRWGIKTITIQGDIITSDRQEADGVYATLMDQLNIAGKQIAFDYDDELVEYSATLRSVTLGEPMGGFIPVVISFESAESYNKEVDVTTETHMDYSSDPNGVVKTEMVPVFDMQWDPTAVQQNLMDAKYVYRGRWIDKMDFQRQWGLDGDFLKNYKDEQLTSRFANAQPHDQSKAWMYLDDPRDWVHNNGDQVLVVDYQYRGEQDAILYRLPDGTLEWEGVDTWEQLRTEMQELMGYDPVSQGVAETKAPCYYSVHLAGEYVLQKVKLPYRGFTYNCITGFQDRSTQYPTYFGLMRLMKDPQNWANKFLSQLIHIIGTNPKGGVVVGPSVFDDNRQAREQWARPDGFLVANKQIQPGDIQHLPTGNMPVAQLQLFDRVSDMVPTAAGVNMNYFAGQAEDLRRTAGHAVESVQRQAAAVLAPIFDSFKRYRKNQGKLMLRFMREHAEVNQLVRISGPPLAKYAQLAMSDMFQRYDVVVDESPVSANSEHETWKTMTDQGFLMQLLQANYFPVQALPMLTPNIPQPVRDMWTDHINAVMAQPPAEPPAEGEQPV